MKMTNRKGQGRVTVPDITMEFDSVKFKAYAKGLKQQDLAKTLGITRPTLLDRIKNTENLKLTEFLTICVELNMPPTSFLVDAAQK